MVFGVATLTVAEDVTVMGRARRDKRGEFGADAERGFNSSCVLGLVGTKIWGSCSCFFAPMLVLRWG